MRVNPFSFRPNGGWKYFYGTDVSTSDSKQKDGLLLDYLSDMSSSLWSERHTHEAIESEFSDLVLTWKAERGFSSSMEVLVIHPAYQRIIGMGKDALPLLLRELKREPDHWFWALKAITGVDPVQDEDKGRIGRMSESWLEWGRNNGY